MLVGFAAASFLMRAHFAATTNRLPLQPDVFLCIKL